MGEGKGGDHMYCNQCGKQLPDNAQFCRQCGNRVGVNPGNEIPAQQPEKKKGKRGKVILICVIVAVVVALTAGAVILFTGQKTVGELPDPEYYFANGPIDEVNEYDDVKQVILRSDEDLWDEAAGYVNLLKWSGKYQVTQSDEERYSSGDYMWNFVYNNTADIKSPYFCQVEVNYYCKSNGRDVYAVWITIHDTDALDLVQKERYEETYTAPETTPDTGYSDGSDSGYVDSGNSGTSNSWDDSSDDWSDSSSDWEDDTDDYDYEVPDSSDIYDAETPCGVCDGDGDCQTCGGDGYLMSSASDEEDRNCYSCSGSGNCRSCGGDGSL